MKMTKFDALYKKLIFEMTNETAETVSKMEVIEDIINDELIPNGVKVKPNWHKKINEINAGIREDLDAMDYMDACHVVMRVLLDLNLIYE